MLGDIVIDARLAFSKISDSNKAPLSLGGDGLSINVKGKYAIQGRRAVTTADGTLPLGDIGTIGYLALRNMAATLIDTPAAPSIANIGTAGATTYTYKIVAKQSDGGYTIASAAGTTTTGNATLSSTNLNRLTWTAVDNATSYDVYRTVGGATQGKIGNVTSATIDDTGLAGDSSTAPATTPFDFAIQVGSDGVLYPILVKGGDVQVVRWNQAAIHHKATFNNCDLAYLIVEA